MSHSNLATIDTGGEFIKRTGIRQERLHHISGSGQDHTFSDEYCMLS